MQHRSTWSPLKFVVNMNPPQSSSWFSFLHPLFTIKLFILIIQARPGLSGLEDVYETCGKSFSCGGITDIGYPFRGSNNAAYCGHPSFVLTCDENTNVTTLDIMRTQYRVLGIVQSDKIITVVREDIMEDTCPKELVNTTLDHTIFDYDFSSRNFTFLYGCPDWFPSGFSRIPCAVNGEAYAVAGDFGPGMCNTSVIISGTGYEPNTTNLNVRKLDEALQKGFEIKWQMDSKNCSDCVASNGRCGNDLETNQTVCYCPNPPFISHTCSLPNTTASSTPPKPKGVPYAGSSSSAAIIAGAASIAGAIVFTIAIVFYLKRRCSVGGNKPPVKNQDIENILQQHGALAPRRYKYSEIKKITKSFNDKLGQGGFGSVYKGTLPDGSLVAVKVLMETDGNGEDFMNEVASISRTSHVNIVTLLGFCNKGSKRALIYEYMPNKSLDMFLKNNGTAAETDCSLNFKKLYKIAVGIAKGLEYLHSGCNTRIVHFDIKPQNILLDEDLCPKISDFGLAKLCKKKQSILSVIGARGTIGYISPEMFSRNFGGVSHKSDVYSFGMMVLEMAGAKKIVEVGSSEDYFPDNVYKHVVIGGTQNVGDEFMSEEIGRKMYLVGFWCIQTSPSERPSMSKVVEMLEGSVESIQIPPKPTLFSPALPGHNISLPLSAYVESQTTNSDEII